MAAQPTMAQLSQAAGGPPAVNGTVWSASQASRILQQGYDISSIMQGWVDRGAWIYYDRIFQPLTGTGSTFGGATGQLAQTYSAFKLGLNSPDAITQTNKTKNWTNLPNNGQFNPPRCMVLRRLGFYFEPTMALSDIELVLQTAYLEFKIDDKIFFEGLMQFWPGGMGITGYSTASSQAVWLNGLATPHSMRDYGPYAKYIAPLQNFSLTITFPSTNPYNSSSTLLLNPSGTGLNFVCLMDGITDRSVA